MPEPCDAEVTGGVVGGVTKAPSTRGSASRPVPGPALEGPRADPGQHAALLAALPAGDHAAAGGIASAHADEDLHLTCA